MRKFTSLNSWKRFFPKRKAFALTFALIGMVSLQGWGATITSKTSRGFYNDTLTWVGGSVPAATDDVVIAGHVSIEAGNSETCHNLTINDGAILELNNKNFTVNGTLTIVGNGTIIVNFYAKIEYGTTKALVYSGTKAKTVGGEWLGISGPDSVFINNSGGVTIRGSKTVSNLTIHPAGAATINPYYKVTVNNSFLIESSSAGTGSLIVIGTQNSTGSLEGSGIKSVQRYIPSANWHIVSSPVADQGIAKFATAPNNSIYEDAPEDYDLAPYDEGSDAWAPYTNSGTAGIMGVAEGYAMHRSEPGIVTFAGSAINIDSKTFSTSDTKHGWNALGNPFTSALRARGENSFLSFNSDKLDPAYAGMYIWDQGAIDPVLGAGDYQVISNGNYAFPAPGGETELPQDNISVGQGFIVKTDGSQTIYFYAAINKEDFRMQVHATTTTPFKSAEIATPAIRLAINAGEMENKTIVSFEKNMTYGLDPSCDVGKLKGNPDLALYTKLVDGSSNVDFAVQALPDVSFNEVRIPVGLDFPAGGEATFSLEMSTGFGTDAEVYLEDAQTQALTQLNVEDAKYTTSIAAGTEGAGRFYLVVTKYTATGINIPAAENNFKVFNQDNIIYINGPANSETSFALYSIDGKLWTSRRAENLSRNSIDASVFPAGVYLLKINHKGSSQTEKLVLMN